MDGGEIINVTLSSFLLQTCFHIPPVVTNDSAVPCGVCKGKHACTRLPTARASERGGHAERTRRKRWGLRVYLLTFGEILLVHHWCPKEPCFLSTV